MLPHHMKSILVEAWDDFKVSSVKVIRDSFLKTKLPPLRPPNLTKNTQACASYTQVSSGNKPEERNEISCRTVSPIEVQ